MGYLDAQNSARNATTAIAKAEAAKATAESAVAASKAGSLDKATATSLAAEANSAVAAYNTAAQKASESAMFATDWFGITTNKNSMVYDPNFITTSGLDKNLYTPTSYGSVAPTVLPALIGTSGRDLLKATLAELQIPSTILDSSVTFIEKLISDGIGISDATKIYYNNKNYTAKDGITLSSPFYNEFTYLVESAPQTGNPPSPLELMQFKLGVKNLVTQYNRSSLFAADDALKGFISQGVKLTDLDARFAEAATEQLKADPNKVAALKKLGFINGVQDMGDFYLDSKIGQKQFEINRNTAAFTQQAIARASSGITVDADRMKQLAAASGATLGTAANAEQTGATGFETISQQLNPLTKLEGIYNKSAASQTELTPDIQKQLEEEQFKGTASELRKKRIEQEQLAFQAKSGTIQASRLSQGSLGTASMSGLV